MGIQYDESDVVAIPGGRGVVAAALTDVFDEERAKRLTSAVKGELLRTEHWRDRF